MEYLVSLLQDEFGAHSEVRIRCQYPSTTVRSVDMIQDYDAESNDLHTRSGVTVIARSKEFFFPTNWAKAKDFKSIHALIRKISETLE